MATVIVFLLGIGLGWLWCAHRVSKTIWSRLKIDLSGDAISMADGVWWAIVPWPLNRLLARYIERKVR